MIKKLLIAFALAAVVVVMAAPMALAAEKSPSADGGTFYDPEDILGTWVGTMDIYGGPEYDLVWEVEEITNDVFTVTTTVESAGSTSYSMICKSEHGTFLPCGNINLGTWLNIHARQANPPHEPRDISWFTHYYDGTMQDQNTIHTGVCVYFTYDGYENMARGTALLHRKAEEKTGVSGTDKAEIYPYKGRLISVCNGEAVYKMRTGVELLWRIYPYEVYKLNEFRLSQDGGEHQCEILWSPNLAAPRDMTDGYFEIGPCSAIDFEFTYCGMTVGFDMHGYWWGDQMVSCVYALALETPDATYQQVDVGHWSASEYAPGPIKQLSPAAR